MNPAYFAAVALFLAVAGIVAFSPPSTWVAQKVLAPVFAKDAGGDAALSDDVHDAAADVVAPVKVSTETSTCVLPAFACYALQIGIYEDEENARKQAAGLTALGAAGRVTEDNGRYRVLASGYLEQADAKAVQQQLLAEGIESYVYPIQCAERAYTLRGEAAQTEVVTDAAAAIPAVLDDLYEVMIAFDREGMHASEGIACVRAVEETCKAQYDMLSRLPADAAGEIESLAAFYRSLAAEAEDVSDMEAAETAALSARLKALFLHAVYGRAGLNDA